MLERLGGRQPRKRAVRRGLAALLVAASLVGTACGLGDKQRQADLIASGRDAVAAANTARGQLTLRIVPTDRPATADALEGLAQAGPQDFLLTAEVLLVFDGQLAQVTVAPGELPTTEPAPVDPAAEAPAEAPADASTPGAEGYPVVFRGTQLYVKRSNLRPTERRTWAMLDFGRLEDDADALEPGDLDGDRGALEAVAYTISPHYFLDLVLGALAGKMSIAGTEDMGGVATTRYDTNISLDKVTTELDLSDEELEIRRNVFRLAGIRSDVNPASFWIDDDGNIRALQVTFPQVYDRDYRNDLTVTLRLPEYGPQIEIPAPTKDETVVINDYPRLVRAAVVRG